MKKTVLRILWGAALLLGVAARTSLPVQAEGGLFDSPCVKPWAYEGETYWTIDEALPYMDKYYNYTRSGTAPEYWYEGGMVISTGIPSCLRELNRGEHYYSYDRTGEVPIGYWRVEHSHGRCIHTETTTDVWKGLEVGEGICSNAYYSGWFAYCADCGKPVTPALVYASQEAVSSVRYMNVDCIYYYRCPTCNHLENQGFKTPHVCQGISWNMYQVVYDANDPTGLYNGEMAPSLHMYDNHGEYRGEAVTPVSTLALNTYSRTGYTFAGWNTKPDGNGTAYADGAEILNLSEYDYKEDSERGTVTLYAQWKRTESTLNIDPAGGTYKGRSEVTSVTQGYGTVYVADPAGIAAGGKNTVSFDTGGGTAISPVTAARTFEGWQLSNPFYGKMKGNTYAFLGADGITDTLTAVYGVQPIVLPTPTKAGSSFGGWFEDPDCTKPVGTGGDEYSPKGNVTLYAKWVELVLWSYDNYTANDGKGAVNLKWSQPDTTAKTYKLYRAEENGAFSLLYGAKEATEKNATEKSFSYRGAAETYTIPYTGFYTLTAFGAQGGACGSHAGGRGGSVTARFYLTAGEKLTVTVGGQGGYNGGGAATKYGNGGGATVITSGLKGTLLIAGGGGGASPSGNGGAGGSSTSLRADKNGSGAAGQAGGGAGYVGGNAGEQITHTHVTSCYHVHSGSAASGGGCYGTKKTENTECGGDMEFWYECSYDAAYVNGVHLDTCPRCGGRGPCIHKDVIYKCDRCGHTGGSGKCGELIRTTVYELSCSYAAYASGQQVQGNTVCGKTTATVESEKPAYGGSSYVNAVHALSAAPKAGMQAGNGKASVTAGAVGYMNTLTLNGVSAPDLAAPDAVDPDSVVLKPLGAGSVSVSFEEPADNGTTYRWKAESYREGEETLLSTSNITANTLKTGVAGYYYIFDATPVRTVTAVNAQNKGNLLKTPSLTCNMDRELLYLHVAAVDVAGNVGPATHIRIEKGWLDWAVRTDKIQISDIIGLKDCGTVYEKPDAPGTYYVRADGRGAFKLSFSSYLDGEARDNYQIDYQTFAAAPDSPGRTQEYTTRLPYCVPVTSVGELPVSSFVRKSAGASILLDAANTGASRSNASCNNSFFQCFTIPASYNGRTIVVTPVAGATGLTEVTYSSWEKDKQNAITLIADGEAPIVLGTEALESMTLINQNNQTVYLDLSAEDDLSGVKDFQVTVINGDNYINKIYEPDADGHIYIDLTAELPVFSGSFTVKIRAVDQVGNACEMSYEMTEFSLAAHITRILEPHEPLFKCGESGILHITTWGYADYVEVEFPGEMLALSPNLNKTYFYKQDAVYKQEEELRFMIPLHTPANRQYIITVRAYKGDKKLEEHPALSTLSVEGSVADELRTRLR